MLTGKHKLKTRGGTHGTGHAASGVAGFGRRHCRGGRRRACRHPGDEPRAGPANRKAAEVISKYLISDMYAKAVQGMSPEESVKRTHDELVKIYA